MNVKQKELIKKFLPRLISISLHYFVFLLVIILMINIWDVFLSGDYTDIEIISGTLVVLTGMFTVFVFFMIIDRWFKCIRDLFNEVNV